MSRPRSQDPTPPPEPETESHRALVRWLGAVPASRLAFLARASGVDEQTLVAFVERQSRPTSDSEAARLLAIATRGDVPSHGWRTDEEFEAYQGARAHAHVMAHSAEAPQTPRSRAPVSRPMVARRRRRGRGAQALQSARPVTTGPAPSAQATESLLEPPRLTLLLGRGEQPASTERSDPPTQPSSPILPRPSQTAPWAPAVEVVEHRPHDTRRDACRRPHDCAPPSSARSMTAVALAEAIATLTQQGYAIRLERKD